MIKKVLWQDRHCHITSTSWCSTQADTYMRSHKDIHRDGMSSWPSCRAARPMKYLGKTVPAKVLQKFPCYSYLFTELSSAAYGEAVQQHDSPKPFHSQIPVSYQVLFTSYKILIGGCEIFILKVNHSFIASKLLFMKVNKEKRNK